MAQRIYSDGIRRTCSYDRNQALYLIVQLKFKLQVFIDFENKLLDFISKRYGSNQVLFYPVKELNFSYEIETVILLMIHLYSL